jgi:hypothetical protein
MRPYLLVFKIKPQPNNPRAQDIGGALATVFVFATTTGAAQEKSVIYLNNQSWDVEAIEYAHAPTLMHIFDLGVVLLSVYRKAELNGIAVQIDGWQKDESFVEHSLSTLQ